MGKLWGDFHTKKHNSLTHAGCMIRLLIFFFIFFFMYFYHCFYVAWLSRMLAFATPAKAAYTWCRPAATTTTTHLPACSVDCHFSKVYCKFLPTRSYFEMSTPPPAPGIPSGSGDARCTGGNYVYLWNKKTINLMCKHVYFTRNSLIIN